MKKRIDFAAALENPHRDLITREEALAQGHRDRCCAFYPTKHMGGKPSCNAISGAPGMCPRTIYRIKEGDGKG